VHLRLFFFAIYLMGLVTILSRSIVPMMFDLLRVGSGPSLAGIIRIRLVLIFLRVILIPLIQCTTPGYRPARCKPDGSLTHHIKKDYRV
jgi:hypothetical protein